MNKELVIRNLDNFFKEKSEILKEYEISENKYINKEQENIINKIYIEFLKFKNEKFKNIEKKYLENIIENYLYNYKKDFFYIFKYF